MSWTLAKQTDCRNVGLDNFDTPRLAPLGNCVTRKCNQEKLQKLLLLISCVQIEFCVVILLHEKFLQFDWLRAVVFQLNLKNTYM